MNIQYFELSHFRNLNSVKISPNPGINLIHGKNASGKTSLLEALYFLSMAKSFRTPHSHHLIQFNTEQFQLFGKISEGDKTIPIGIIKEHKNLKIKMANAMVSSASDLTKAVPVQIINTDSHKLIEDGPRYRRKFLEWGLFHVKPNYFQLWQNCRQLLKQRNAALKSGWKKKEITHWNVLLQENAEELNLLRETYIAELMETIRSMAIDLQLPFLEQLTIKLKRGWPKDKTLEEALESVWEIEQKKGFTQYGPHRVDIEILIEGIVAKNIVSRGQQKTIATVLKLAQGIYLQKTRNTSPMLLVDDLAAELDEDLQKAMFAYLEKTRFQVFITSTTEGIFRNTVWSNKPKMFHVKQGNILEIESQIE